MIVVTGMHRSGTSAVTQLLAELGMDLGDPDQLLAADDWNAQGYWENLRVLLCNDQLVMGGGGFYPKPYYRLPRPQRPGTMRLRMSLLWMRFTLFPSLSAIERRAARRNEEMKQLTEEFQGRVVKDPRFCVTLSSWQRHRAAERVLVMLRRPDEVANSLSRRNRLPRRFGLSLWRLHYRALLQALEGLPVVFVDFNRLLQKDTCDAELERVWAFSGRSVRPEIKTELQQRVINPRLATGGGPLQSIDKSTATLYRQLQQYHADYNQPRSFQLTTE